MFVLARQIFNISVEQWSQDNLIIIKRDITFGGMRTVTAYEYYEYEYMFCCVVTSLGF